MFEKRANGIVIAVSLVVLSFITLTMAEENIPPAKEKLIEEVIEITGIEKQAETFLSEADSLLESFPGQQPKTSVPLKKSLLPHDMYCALYDQLFTENELRELIAFLKSPVGKKFLKVTPDVSEAIAMRVMSLATTANAPRLEEARKEAKKYECMSNLKQIGMALKMYAVDYDEQFPANLEDVYPLYVIDANIFKCPASDSSADTPATYTYVKGLTEAHPGNTIIVYDSSVTNHGDGRNVLFVDGHVEWMGEKKFQEALKRNLK